MAADLSFIFDCPNCHNPFAETKETEIDVHSGATYRCASCDGRVVFLALTVEEYADPSRLKMDCYFCKPEPCRFGPSTTTDNQEKGELT